MTPEQNEQWKTAVLPMVLDFSQERQAAERTLIALLPEAERDARVVQVLERWDYLTGWVVPDWAIDLRSTLIFYYFFYFESLESWHWELAIRSEVALVGIQILNPDYKNRLSIYERVFVRFVAEVLRPMVEYGRLAIGYRKRGYEPLNKLYELCENFITSGDAREWPEPDVLFPPQLIQVQHFDVEDPEACEVCDVAEAGYLALTQIRSIFDTGEGVIKEEREFDPLAWPTPPTSFTDDMVLHLDYMHVWRMGIDIHSVEGSHVYGEPMAQAYLTALEAECPPPNWLPRV